MYLCNGQIYPIITLINQTLTFIMKFQLYFSILLVLLLVSCTENDSPDNNAALNSIENTIKGKWLLKSKSDSLFMNKIYQPNASESYTAFTGEPYIELLATKTGLALQMGGPTSKNLTDAGTNLGLINLGPPLPVTRADGYWFYDEKSKTLVVNGVNLSVLKSTSKDLVLQFKYQDLYSINWTYKR